MNHPLGPSIQRNIIYYLAIYLLIHLYLSIHLFINLSSCVIVVGNLRVPLKTQSAATYSGYGSPRDFGAGSLRFPAISSRFPPYLNAACLRIQYSGISGCRNCTWGWDTDSPRAGSTVLILRPGPPYLCPGQGCAEIVGGFMRLLRLYRRVLRQDFWAGKPSLHVYSGLEPVCSISSFS